ncbi:hypothetical protein [Flavobacterium sp.]|jgi:hypothetical protein|uniref:hypothetical protein n=1 Tax=Flavobacterium sp. TaxID=239 RepID=UPI0037C03031
MKKIIGLLTISLSLLSCSNDNEEFNQEESNLNLKETILEKYDGKIFRFNDNDDFLKFYNDLSNLNPKEFNDFLLIKNDNNSIYYRNLSNEEEIVDEETSNEGKVEKKSNTEIVLSEYISTIFNYDNNIMIGNDVIFLNEKGELISTSKNEIIGSLHNSSLSNNELNRHNVNYTKSWTITNGSKRVTLSIFNESLYINNALSSSKIFYRVHQQYKSCSFWRCTWKNDDISAQLSPNLSMSGTCQWTNNGINGFEFISSAVFTKNISNYVFVGPCALNTIYITGSFNYARSGYSTNFSNIAYDFNPF